MRCRLAIRSVLVGLALVGGAARGEVLVDLDAAALPPGDLSRCTAAGTAGLALTAGGADSVTAGVVAGRPAVSFSGADGLVSSFAVPAALTGRAAFSVAAWVFNPKVGGEEPILQWAGRGTDSRAAVFGYGTAPTYGAIMHWGEGDMGFEGRPPAAGAWHHLAITYGGGVDGVERLYVDGECLASERKSLDLHAGGRIHVGQSGDGPGGLSGAIASLRMDAAELSADDVEALARGETVAAKAVVLLDAATLPAGPLMAWENSGAAGGTFRRASIPRVETIGGRQAIACEAGQRLVGDAALDPLAGRPPFTLEAWIWNPDVGRAEAYATLAPADRPPVLFQCGSSARDGGLATDSGGLPFALVPGGAAWHHVAVVSTGDSAAVYADGELEAQGDLPLAFAAGPRLAIGAGGRRAFTGAIARLRLHDCALDQPAVRREAGMIHAFAPEPARSATVAVRRPTLRWRAGMEGVSQYVVYAGTQRAAVEQRDPATRIAEVAAPTTSVEAPPLPVAASCHWCVDELTADGRVAGPGVVWSFRVDDGRAREPLPRDRTANTSPGQAELRWRPGPFAVRQRLFFGTDEATVRAATQPVATLAAEAATSAPPGPLRPGTRYFWRVDGDDADGGTAAGVVWSFRTQDEPTRDEFTFFVVTDTHYTADPASFAGVRAVIDAMNWLPGADYPAALGGTVRTPVGVLHGGDMLDDGAGPTAAEVWRIFTADFGVNGEGRLCYPLYEIVGNHDAGDGSPPQEGVRARNRLRRGLAALSDNGLHYSWDWGGVHFVALNKFSGSGPDPRRPFNQPWNDPTGSLEFLAADLPARGAGRPVILLQHYGFDDFSAGWGWWSPEDRAATWEVIRDSNVVAYLHGHTHAMTFMKWRGEDIHGPDRRQPTEGIDVIGCGAGQRGPDAPGEFMVFRVRPDEVAVAHRFVDRWGETRRIPIPPEARWGRGADTDASPPTRTSAIPQVTP